MIPLCNSTSPSGWLWTHVWRKSFHFPHGDTEHYQFKHENMFLLIWTRSHLRSKGQKSLAIICPCRQNHASAFDRQNLNPLCFPSLCPNHAIQKWMWSRAATSVFPVDICKTLYLLSILEGSCLLLSFPPNWSSQLEVWWGAGGRESQPRRTAENLCLTPPAGLQQHGPGHARGISIAPLGCW